jgi:hypothetical protein
MAASPNSTSFAAIIADSFTRPADTNAYAVGDLVANSTTAASVVPLAFDNASIATGICRIDGARIRKSTATTTAASFRLHLFHAAPSVATTGDNGAFGTVVSGAASYLGAIDVTIDRAFADGAAGSGIPMRGSPLNVSVPAGQIIYGLLEARGAYTPASAEVFTVTLEVFRFTT